MEIREVFGVKLWKKRLFSGLGITAAVLLLWQLLSLWSAFCVARVAYTGLQNMFHVPYEYYALTPAGSVRVLSPLVRLVYGGEAMEKGVFDDPSTQCWYAELVESPTGEGIGLDGPSLPTSFGADTRLYYQPWTRESREPGAEELAALSAWAEKTHREVAGWTWQGEGNTCYLAFLLYRHGDRLVLEFEKDLYWVQDEDFRLLMTQPKRGHLEYLYFP